ncbi:uncharacterized protein LOC113207871 isoform X3 [Frankliniella occidentalis]|uniref:Uncharacterized protein LOC113207871 isoform X3 n=1 Tax=Frankliniella occidentalis TaxID=133901 RepID=A0A6J1SM56_FRAOC|nr:uncharacterized protein LOC113207871 isoform X3 [Frankliniella occidentalis]
MARKGVWGAETPISLYCRCKQVVHWEDPELSTDTTQILPGIEGILCPTCGLCIGLNHVQEWIPIKECLLDSSQADGWCLAEGLWDRAIHWILSQFIYRTVEPPNLESRETLFDVPDPTDVIYLLWIGGKAAGFCTLKPTGPYTLSSKVPILKEHQKNMPCLQLTLYLSALHTGEEVMSKLYFWHYQNLIMT